MALHPPPTLKAGLLAAAVLPPETATADMWAAHQAQAVFALFGAAQANLIHQMQLNEVKK
jgi:hypothetical protein